ncbi:hypothetical protein CEXT_600171 [Caerostris extrusa]|uniref:Uncharacterized protein n=1 Tax=Caerostris extrusa TaxID=172846 RepID=A0AAV4Q6V3_CAEEX|nr:hypothetical protein CEXT_600171 [Caerostris extrusa]
MSNQEEGCVRTTFKPVGPAQSHLPVAYHPRVYRLHLLLFPNPTSLTSRKKKIGTFYFPQIGFVGHLLRTELSFFKNNKIARKAHSKSTRSRTEALSFHAVVTQRKWAIGILQATSSGIEAIPNLSTGHTNKRASK